MNELEQLEWKIATLKKHVWMAELESVNRRLGLLREEEALCKEMLEKLKKQLKEGVTET